MKNSCTRWLLLSWLAIYVSQGLLSAATCEADTLYDRSRALMVERERVVSPRDFTFVVMGDSRGNDPVFRKGLALAAGYKPLFILHSGDFSMNGSEAEVDHFLEVVRDSVPDIPLFVVPGNHEQKKPFLAKVGPLDFTIDSARLGLAMIVVDNSAYSLKMPQWSFLKSQLARKRKVAFVAMHVPPRTERWRWHTFADGAADLIRLLAEKNVTAAFYGHVHLYDRDDIEGVPHFITGGAGAPLVKLGFPGNPVYHILVVRVKDGGATCQMVKIKE
ncbi:MAG TPA: metallophosphoesterase [Geobacteraceae bacterium]|nr:metallophosphoesterase [Geobacteraceae bacterium]